MRSQSRIRPKRRTALFGSAFALTAILLTSPTEVMAQTCAWGGGSAAASPAVTSLRSEHEFFRSPVRVAVDLQGNVYTADPGKSALVVTDSRGRLVGTHEGFLRPVSVAVDATGNAYVGEQETGAVSVFDEQWNLSHRLGAGAGEFLIPNDIAIDPDPENGSVYVSDGEAHVIKVYDAAGAFRFSFGGKGTEAGRLDFPSAVHVTGAGEIYVADQSNDRVQVFDRAGNFLRCFGSSGSSSFSTKFGRLTGITSDAQGRLYVADAFQDQVKVFDAQGAELATIGRLGAGPGELRTPVGLAIDPNNRLWVASLNSARLELFGLDDFIDPQVTHATIDGPDLLVRRRSRFISVLVEIPGVSLSEVDTASLTANGIPARSAGSAGDADQDGIPDLTVVFPRSLLATLPTGQSTLVVAGQFLAGGVFEGYATVNVATPGSARGRRVTVPRSTEAAR